MAAKKSPSSPVPIIEEQMRVGKRHRLSGQVRVRTITETLNELTTASLSQKHVEVRRVAINRDVDEAPSIRRSGYLLIVPVLEEVLVIEKRLRLREELHIRQLTRRREVKVPLKQRVQRATVERSKERDTGSSRNNGP
jgi:hypothetical protein